MCRIEDIGRLGLLKAFFEPDNAPFPFLESKNYFRPKSTPAVHSSPQKDASREALFPLT